MYINSFNIDKPYNKIISSHCMDFPGGSVVKILPANEGDMDSTPESGRSLGGANGNPLQYCS